MKPQSISFDEALQKYKIGDYLQGGYNGNVLVYPESLAHQGHFDLFKLLDENTRGIIVQGNLTVNGTINDNIGSGFLIVTGDVRADNIISGESETYLLSDVIVKNVIYGYYNHGSINMRGKVSAKLIINSDHVMNSRYPMEGITISAFRDGDIPNSDFNPNNLSQVLIPQVLDPDGGVHNGTIKKYLLANKSILKMGAESSPRQKVKKPSSPTRKPSSKKDSVTPQITNKNMVTFPYERLKQKNLQKLILSGMAIGNIPKEIAQLENLEELYAADCKLETLPREIGNLKKLRILDISNNNFKILPKEISTMVSLEELNLSASLGSLKELPELSKLANLTTLIFSGTKQNASDPLPSQELLESIWNITNLERLSIDHWGEEGVYGMDAPITVEGDSLTKNEYINLLTKEGKGSFEEGIKQILNNPNKKSITVIIRPPLHSISEKIGNLVHLKYLDISFNNLTRPPDAFYTLKNLEEVNFSHNKELPYDEIQKIRVHFPHTKLNFSNVPALHDVDNSH